jgi:hypothetical protein
MRSEASKSAAMWTNYGSDSGCDLVPNRIPMDIPVAKLHDEENNITGLAISIASMPETGRRSGKLGRRFAIT